MRREYRYVLLAKNLVVSDVLAIMIMIIIVIIIYFVLRPAVEFSAYAITIRVCVCDIKNNSCVIVRVGVSMSIP